MNSAPHSIIGKKVQINTLVSSAHVVLIIAFTTAVFLIDNALNDSSNFDYQMQSVAVFLGGALDIFISYVMFFVLDREETVVTDFVLDTQTSDQY